MTIATRPFKLNGQFVLTGIAALDKYIEGNLEKLTGLHRLD